MLDITKNHLYFFNSTWRKPNRGIELAKSINEAIEKNQSDYPSIKKLIDDNHIYYKDKEPEEVEESEDKEHSNYNRKKAELLNLGFFTTKQKELENGNSSKTKKNDVELEKWYKSNIKLNDLKPTVYLFNEEIRENEFDSNIFLYLLSKGKHLTFAVQLIEAVNKKWTGQNVDLLDEPQENLRTGKRTSLFVEEWALAFAIHELEDPTKIIKSDNSAISDYANFCADKIVEFRSAYKIAKEQKITADREPEYLVKKIKEYIKNTSNFELTVSEEERAAARGRLYRRCYDYADTNINGLLATNCFSWATHAGRKGISFNEAFKPKLDWFTKEKNRLKINQSLINTQFSNWLYNDKDGIKPQDIVSFYDKEIKGINEQIQLNPNEITIKLEDFLNDDLQWHKYEHDGCIFALQAIYNNDEENYLKAKKELAIKTDMDGNTYGGSTGGIADGFIAFPNIAVSFEMSRLFEEEHQLSKETWQNIKHANKIKKDFNIDKTITFVVFPKPTEKLKQFAIWHNTMSQKNKECNYLIILDSKDYVTGLNTINTLDGFTTLHSTINHHDWKNESDSTIFKTLVGANLEKKNDIEHFKLN